MITVNKVIRKIQMSHWNTVKFQVLTYCYLKNIQISDSDLECITYLAIKKEDRLHTLCAGILERGTFKSLQSVRNALDKIEKKGLITKEGKNKKKVILSDQIKVTTEGSILLNYNILGLESS